MLQEIAPLQTEKQCRAIITQWAKNGVITIGVYYDEKERKENEGIISVKTVGVETAP